MDILKTCTFHGRILCFAAKLQCSFTVPKQNGFDFTLFLEQNILLSCMNLFIDALSRKKWTYIFQQDNSDNAYPLTIVQQDGVKKWQAILLDDCPFNL